jgi:SET domain-containing protein
MNHDCEPTASLVGKRVSGKYRVEVNTRKDIRNGEEITVDYGPEFWEKGLKALPTTS